MQHIHIYLSAKQTTTVTQTTAELCEMNTTLIWYLQSKCLYLLLFQT